MAGSDCLWRPCPVVSIHCLAAPYTSLCCCHALDNCCPFQHAFDICDHLLLLERLVLKNAMSLCFQVIWIHSTLCPFFLVAGWIGDDAVTPIIGEHDPYIHVYGRVSSTIIRLSITLNYETVLVSMLMLVHRS